MSVSVLRVPVDLPYVAAGRPVEDNWHVLARLATSDGVEGVGYIVYPRGDLMTAIAHAARELGEHLVGMSVLEPEAAWDRFRALLEARAVDVLIIDLARAGGITPWRKIAALAQAHEISVYGHVVPEIHVHLVAAVPNGWMVEYVPRSAAILQAMPAIENGQLVAPEAPGLGLVLDEGAISRYAVA